MYEQVIAAAFVIVGLVVAGLLVALAREHARTTRWRERAVDAARDLRSLQSELIERDRQLAGLTQGQAVWRAMEPVDLHHWTNGRIGLS